MTVVVKTGDIFPIEFVANGDLTDATVRLLAKRKSPTGDTIVLDNEVTDAVNGVVQHTLTGTLEVADYRVEVEASRDGEIVTFPNNGYETLRVIDDLG